MHVRRLIRRHFTEGVSPKDRTRMRVHLRSCEVCRTAYDQFAEVMRAAADQTPTRTETTALRQTINAVLFQPQGTPPGQTMLIAPSWLLKPLVAGLTCSLVLIFSYLIFSPPPDLHTAVQYRGGPTDPPLVSIEVFAIRRQNEGFSPPRQVAPNDTITIDEFIQFRYKNNNPRLRHLYLLGLDPRWSPLDYFPRPDQQSSIPIHQAVEGEIISPSIHLHQRHQEGPLWIYALFSGPPLSRKTVHQWIKDGEKPREGSAIPGRINPDPEVILLTYRFKLARGLE